MEIATNNKIHKHPQKLNTDEYIKKTIGGIVGNVDDDNRGDECAVCTCR